jgi:N-carbamoylputrescine amidase
MRIALVQLAVTSDREASIQAGLRALKEAAQAGAQIVAFPELSFTPFFPQKRLAGDRFEHSEPVPGATTERFAQAAREAGVVVVLNLFERVGDRAYDSSPVIDSDGTLLGCARMMHITHYEGFWEQDYYDPGDTGAPVFETSAGRIGVAICYDRHYPEYLRALALQKADLVIVPQAGALGEWPEGLFEAEMRVASFHHGFYCALVNRVGKEEVLTFGGGSFVTSPEGQVVARAREGEDEILYADLDPDACERSPARSLFLKHRRPEEYDGGSVRL